MNMRRIGLLVTLASAMALAACGGDEKPAETPAASAAPPDTGAPTATAEATPPPPTATATQDATPPPPPAKPAKDKLIGNFGQDFSGAVKDAADADAKKKAGKNDKDGKKYNAAMDAAAKKIAGNTIAVTADTITHSTGGKQDASLKYEVVSSDDSKVTIKFDNDAAKGKAVKGMTGNTCDITFSDDNTFSETDCFAKDPKKAMVLVYKRQ